MSQRVFSTILTESVLPACADSVVGTINGVKEKYSLANRLIADTIDLSRFRANGREDPDRILDFVRRKRIELGAKNVGLVSLETDTYYDSFGQILELDYSSARDSWVKDFLDAPVTDRFSLYDPDDSVELYSFFFDSKIKSDAGELTGIIGTGISLDSFSLNIAGDKGRTRMFFAEPDGELRLPLDCRGSSFFEEYNLNSPTEDLGDESHYLTEKGGATLMLYIRFISEIERYLIIEHDITDSYKDLQRQSIITFAAGMVFSLLLVAINHILVFRAGRKLSIKGYTDSLTESYNRHFLEEYFGRRNCNQRQISLMTLDIDHFKEVNDNLGHMAGDLILKEVSRLAKSHIRDEDFIVRWGGDEFIIVVHTDIQRALDISERIRARIEQESSVTVTIGVTEMREHEDFTAALSRADEAMYRAKHEGRNKVHCAG
ncbi:GGDEF domain-containing protein [Marispirochaeta sp.]|uniref:GGDEF domain-containing protein n=1 Tax=Marispirochaeta sp. TaxID=2038653 RepID=UPI0029C9AD7F|nr:GGDEF domain-containing protein [Marispirochaeta sp.]